MTETLFDRIFPYLLLLLMPMGAFISAWMYSLPNHSCYTVCLYPIPAMFSVVIVVGAIIVD